MVKEGSQLYRSWNVDVSNGELKNWQVIQKDAELNELMRKTVANALNKYG